MKKIFVIMQIGNIEVDSVFNEVISPSIQENGFEPIRIDKHNQGGLLHNEILSNIEESQIIIADLTNERPNCYLEIGYTLGIGKQKNLILMAKEDHNPDSPNHKKGGSKVHFDLTGYDILFWDPTDFLEAKELLSKKIKRRLFLLSPQTKLEDEKEFWDWVHTNEETSIAEINDLGLKGFMSVAYSLSNKTINFSASELMNAMEKSQIEYFGWPIGIVLNKDGYRPNPRPDGITAKIARGNQESVIFSQINSFDYWYLKKNGDFFLIKSIFEDIDNKSEINKYIFFNTRIVRVTEVFLHCLRLFQNLNISKDEKVLINIKHGGLAGRLLSTSNNNRHLSREALTMSDMVESTDIYKFSQIENNLNAIVKKVCSSIFEQFDFYEFNDSIYNDIIDKYLNGRTT